MIITPHEFEKMTLLHQKHDFIRIKDGTLYKEISNLTSDPEFIKYLSTLSIPGVILPKELIYYPNKALFGYTMPYISNSLNIEEFMRYKEFLEIDIVKTITTIFHIVEEIHKHFIISDIHNKNFLLTKDKPYIIDCDNGFKFDGIPKDYSILYNIIIDSKVLYTSVLSDNFKTLISMLCFYYRHDFEGDCLNNDIINIFEYLIKVHPSSPFIKYFDYLLEQALKGNCDNINSFDKYIKNLCPPSENTLKRFKL